MAHVREHEAALAKMQQAAGHSVGVAEGDRGAVRIQTHFACDAAYEVLVLLLEDAKFFAYKHLHVAIPKSPVK